jgi:hypothetical protein
MGLAAELTNHLGSEKADPAGPWLAELAEREHAEDAGDRDGAGSAGGTGGLLLSRCWCRRAPAALAGWMR